MPERLEFKSRKKETLPEINQEAFPERHVVGQGRPDDLAPSQASFFGFHDMVRGSLAAESSLFNPKSRNSRNTLVVSASFAFLGSFFCGGISSTSVTSGCISAFFSAFGRSGISTLFSSGNGFGGRIFHGGAAIVG